MIKAIIFDLWGTLFDQEATVKPFEEIAAKVNREYNDPIFYTAFSQLFMTGHITNLESTMQEFTARIGIEADNALIAELCEIFRKRRTVKTFAYPETIVVLKELRKQYKIAMLSNTTEVSQQSVSDTYPITELFDAIILSYEVGVQKPNPRIYEIALKKLNISKNEAIMVGDSLRLDVQGAESFGIKGVLIDRKNKNPNYPYRITSLNELSEMITRIEQEQAL